MNMLSLGHLSPSENTPRSLRKLLLEIQSHLPSLLRLPHDPTGEFWKFYLTLSCTTVLEKGKMLAVASISFLDSNDNFEIFDILNMPVPMKDTIVATEKLPNILLTID